MDIEESDSYIDVKSHWDQLNRTYKSGELAVDWEIHQQIWEQFDKPKGYKLKILLGFEKNECTGIIPFKYKEADQNNRPGYILGEEAIIAREYFTPPEKLHQFLPLLPAHTATHLSCFYLPFLTDRFTVKPGGVVDLKNSESEYYYSLDKKKRHALMRNFRENVDLKIQVVNRILDNEIRELAEKYIQYWEIKNALNGNGGEVDSREKIMIDFQLLRRAEEMGKLIALHFYLNDKLIAVNYSVRREAHRVDDYLCLRDNDEVYARRGLGIYAILKNMEYCRQQGIRYYDLSDFPAAYKRKFINTNLHYYTYLTPDIHLTDMAVIEMAPQASLSYDILQEGNIE